MTPSSISLEGSARLIQKSDGHAMLEGNFELFETRAYRVYGGGGTRIGRADVGGGVSESLQRLEQIDVGTITLTTKHENRSVQLAQALSVSPWPDAIEVSTQRRAKSQVHSVAKPLVRTMAVAAVEFSLRRATEET